MTVIELDYLKKDITSFPFMHSLIKIHLLNILDRINYYDQCQSFVGDSMASFLLHVQDENFGSFN